jgi:hypothetical protein
MCLKNLGCVEIGFDLIYTIADGLVLGVDIWSDVLTRIMTGTVMKDDKLTEKLIINKTILNHLMISHDVLLVFLLDFDW